MSSPPQASVSLADLRKTRTLAAGLLSLAENTPREELENLGIRPEDVDALRADLAFAERAIPKATELAMAAMTGTLPKEMILTGYTRAQRGMHALAPLLVLRAAAKLDDDQAPGSVRLMVEMMKGLGLLTPAEAVSAPKRVAMLDLEAERKKPLDDLKAEILRNSA